MSNFRICPSVCLVTSFEVEFCARTRTPFQTLKKTFTTTLAQNIHYTVLFSNDCFFCLSFGINWGFLYRIDCGKCGKISAPCAEIAEIAYLPIQFIVVHFDI